MTNKDFNINPYTFKGSTGLLLFCDYKYDFMPTCGHKYLLFLSVLTVYYSKMIDIQDYLEHNLNERILLAIIETRSCELVARSNNTKQLISNT